MALLDEGRGLVPRRNAPTAGDEAPLRNRSDARGRRDHAWIFVPSAAANLASQSG